MVAITGGAALPGAAPPICPYTGKKKQIRVWSGRSMNDNSSDNQQLYILKIRKQTPDNECQGGFRWRVGGCGFGYIVFFLHLCKSNSIINNTHSKNGIFS